MRAYVITKIANRYSILNYLKVSTRKREGLKLILGFYYETGPSPKFNLGSN